MDTYSLKKLTDEELQQEMNKHQQGAILCYEEFQHRRDMEISEEVVKFKKDLQTFLKNTTILYDEMEKLETLGKSIMDRHGSYEDWEKERLLLESMTSTTFLFLIRLSVLISSNK